MGAALTFGGINMITYDGDFKPKRNAKNKKVFDVYILEIFGYNQERQVFTQQFLGQTRAVSETQAIKQVLHRLGLSKLSSISIGESGIKQRKYIAEISSNDYFGGYSTASRKA